MDLMYLFIFFCKLIWVYLVHDSFDFLKVSLEVTFLEHIESIWRSSHRFSKVIKLFRILTFPIWTSSLADYYLLVPLKLKIDLFLLLIIEIVVFLILINLWISDNAILWLLFLVTFMNIMFTHVPFWFFDQCFRFNRNPQADGFPFFQLLLKVRVN